MRTATEAGDYTLSDDLMTYFSLGFNIRTPSTQSDTILSYLSASLTTKSTSNQKDDLIKWLSLSDARYANPESGDITFKDMTTLVSIVG